MTMQRLHLTLAASRAAIEAMLNQAMKEPNRPVAMAVVDELGEVIMSARMDGTRPTPRLIAVKKAYTAARSGSDSGAFAERMKAQGRSPNELDPGMVGVQGGIVVTKDGVILGGIGVSGLAAAEDEALCRIGLAAMKL